MYSKGTVGGLPLRIITNRLEIIPYNRPQLEKAINDPSGAAQEIDAIYGTVPYEIERSKRKVYAMKLGIIDENPKAWLFATAWIIISRQSRLIVGEIGFKGLRANGEVELGYGTRQDSRCRGIMTEAIEALCRFAFEQQDFPIQKITAVTRKNNHASETVLLKNGFIKRASRFGMNYWMKMNDANAGSRKRSVEDKEMEKQTRYDSEQQKRK